MFEFNMEQEYKISLMSKEDQPAHVAQYNAERKMNHDQIDLTRKAEEMFSKAFEEISNRIEDANECNKSKFEILDKLIEKQQKSLEAYQKRTDVQDKNNQ